MRASNSVRAERNGTYRRGKGSLACRSIDWSWWSRRPGSSRRAAAPRPRRRRGEEPDQPSSGYSFSTGRGLQDFPAAPVAVKAAVYEAMEDLKMTIKHGSRDGAVSQIEGRTSNDQTVTVTIRPQQGQTHVSCRIGWFGDDPLSKTLLERVGVRLGTLPPAAIPDKLPSAPSSNPFFSRDAIPDSIMYRKSPMPRIGIGPISDRPPAPPDVPGSPGPDRQLGSSPRDWTRPAASLHGQSAASLTNASRRHDPFVPQMPEAARKLHILLGSPRVCRPVNGHEDLTVENSGWFSERNGQRSIPARWPSGSLPYRPS